MPNPAFLDAMPEVAKKIRQPCAAVVTTDKVGPRQLLLAALSTT